MDYAQTVTSLYQGEKSRKYSVSHLPAGRQAFNAAAGLVLAGEGRVTAAPYLGYNYFHAGTSPAVESLHQRGSLMICLFSTFGYHWGMLENYSNTSVPHISICPRQVGPESFLSCPMRS